MIENLLWEVDIELNLQAAFRHLWHGQQTCLRIDDPIVDPSNRHALACNLQHRITRHILVRRRTNRPSI